MRKLCWILGILILLTAPARALEVQLTEAEGVNGTVVYPYTGDEAADALLRDRLHLTDALDLLAGGAQMHGETHTCTFTLGDGTRVMSLCMTIEGDIHFGRYSQQVYTALLDLNTGEEIPLSRLLDEEKAADRLSEIVLEVQEALNAYLDAGDLTPVPLESVCFDERGMTVHYPAERFSYFSGHAGAVELRYYELADVWTQEMLSALETPLAPGEQAESIRSAAKEGVLWGLEELRVGALLSEALEQFGTLTEPDYITNGEIYEFEHASLRGVYVIAARGAENDASATIQAVRSRRISLGGLCTGVSMREDCLEMMGTPSFSVTLDADTAEYMRLEAGSMDVYPAEKCELKLYYDGEGCLYAAEVAWAQ